MVLTKEIRQKLWLYSDVGGVSIVADIVTNLMTAATEGIKKLNFMLSTTIFTDTYGSSTPKTLSTSPHKS
jgi:hypothetical protein